MPADSARSPLSSYPLNGIDANSAKSPERPWFDAPRDWPSV